MKSNEFLAELFKAPMPWQWVNLSGRESDEYEATFTVGKVPYIWYAFNENIPNKSWEITFTIDARYADEHNLIDFGITGTGNSTAVMTTVVEITKAFLQEHGDRINRLMFSAEEDSRFSLYKRMVQRLLPNWKMMTSGSYFYLTRN